MLREHDTVFRRLLMITDAGLITGAFVLSYLLRWRADSITDPGGYILFLPIILSVWFFLLYYSGAYSSFRLKQIPAVILNILRTALLGFIIFASFLYILKIQNVSRLFIGLAFGLAAAALIIEKAGLLLFLRHVRRRGLNFRNLLIVGTGRRAQAFIESVRAHNEWGYRIIGLIDDDAAKAGEEIGACRVIGTLKDIPEVLHNNIVDEVLFIVPRSWLGKIEEAMRFCESMGTRIHLAVDYFQLQFTKSRQSRLNGVPLLTFESTTDKHWHLLLKRAFDIMASGLALIALSPAYLVIAALVRRTSPGPVFFGQERCSLNGRKFTLYKFRTMAADAESRLEGLMAGNEMQGPAFKMANDPRLTTVGKFLRRSSLDELPQLWNVFRGDMSLVGPRPPLPSEVQKYDSWQRRRLSIRPGITCLWQVNGRNRITDFNEWANLDLKYIDTWSLWLDFKILFKTIPAMLSGTGAK